MTHNPPALQDVPLKTSADVRNALLAQQEIALIDVREEHPFAQAHPLFAANFPAGKLEIEAYTRIPRRSTPIVVYDDGEGLAEPAARTLQKLGYTQVSLLAGGCKAGATRGAKFSST